MQNKLPLQPIALDEQGVLRFRKNKLVDYLLDHGGLTLNDLAVAPELQDCREDWEQFSQLIGYSVSGFGDLSYVSDETYSVAQQKSENLELSDTEIRLADAEDTINRIREGLKQIVPVVFSIHPDDLSN